MWGFFTSKFLIILLSVFLLVLAVQQWPSSSVYAAAACDGQLHSGTCHKYTCGNNPITGFYCIDNGVMGQWSSTCSDKQGFGVCEYFSSDSTCTPTATGCAITNCQQSRNLCGGGGGGGSCPGGSACTQDTQCPGGWCDSTPGVNTCNCGPEPQGPCEVNRCDGPNACGTHYVGIKGGCTPSGSNDCCPNGSCTYDSDCVVAPPPPPASPPNLKITSVSVNDSGAIPSGSVPGSTVPVTVNLVNNGGSDANSFEVAVDKKSTGVGVTCGTIGKSVVKTIGSLATGASTSVVLNMPTPVGPGAFTAAAMVDSKCQVAESNETQGDNVRTDAYNVAVRPNLAVTSFSIPSGASGTTVNATVGIINNGFASANNFIVGIDKKNPNKTMACGMAGLVQSAATTLTNVAPNNTVTLTIPVTLPAGVNSFQGGVMLDSGCTVNEYDEADNIDYHTYSTTGPTFFQTFGGNVTIGNKIDNRSVPSVIAGNTQFLSMNDTTTKSDAGVVSSNVFTAMVYPAGSPTNRISQQSKTPNTPPGWNLVPYVSTSDLTAKVDYQSFYETIKKNAGFTDADVTSTSGNCGNDVGFAPKTPGWHVWCYATGANNFAKRLDAAIANSANPNLVIVPESDLAPFAVTISNSDKTVGNVAGKKKTITAFINNSLTVQQNITSSANASGIAFVVANDLNVDSSVSELDGAYVFSGSFHSGVDDTNPLRTRGMIINTSNLVINLERSISNAITAGETFTYDGKYLDLYKSVLFNTKVKWQELSGL